MASNSNLPEASPIDEVNVFFQHISTAAKSRPAAQEEAQAEDTRPNKWAKEISKCDSGRGKGQNTNKPKPRQQDLTKGGSNGDRAATAGIGKRSR